MQKQALNEIPKHLRPYISTQHYDQYTPIDHAVWRYIMRQNHHALKDVAHPAYTEGLRSSGISMDYIPRVEEMNACLGKAGWGAVTIDGLIPSAAFFGFQGYGMLPIATEIRKVENIEYTPAPDIVHEAAGHAPILLDETYAKYVKLFGEIGSKGFATKEEHELFDAIRTLTIVMESRTSTPKEVEAAKLAVAEKQAAITHVSEILEISRLFWWTVEYGLIGDLENPKIYGAGLLSSVGESKHCLTDAVQKVPYSVEACIQTDYDVTVMQPQLFVCSSFEQLIEGLETYANTMALRRGGTEGLNKALRSGTTATTVLNSGIQITGTIAQVITNSDGEAIYIKTTGPTALSVGNKQLPNHSKDIHADGFGTPIGLLQNDICLSQCSSADLHNLGIVPGHVASLTFKSGIQLSGHVEAIHKNDEHIILISFTNCAISYGEQILFNPSWGSFDLAVGSSVVSVFAGAADCDAFYENVEYTTTMPTVRKWTELEQMYAHVRDVREQVHWTKQTERLLQSLLQKLRDAYPGEWLLRLEILEILQKHSSASYTALKEELLTLSQKEELSKLILNGLTLLEEEVKK
ncbi:aromatic amino acid hydroxylase [Ectobacillus antri]|uniref:aromatic amino acid hydroxylase n=1 Tax=Ectobacillus antri TaxID=2486280 RepID=UPI000F59419E|nr:aromatic amino acid hydroxylase [Ectobacillus antri]